jgi:putative hydrolase of HD superfamily
MQQPDIPRLLEFQQLLLRFSQIQRHIERKQDDKYIPESDTEHSYNLALTAWYLAAYFPHLSRDTVIRYALVHDLVEIHAGDTHIFAEQAHLESKKSRETAAMQQLTHDWPDFPELIADMRTYETHASEEAKFVYALDKIMPIMQIYISGGYTWQKEGITPEQIHAVKHDKVAVSPEIKPYYDELYELFTQNRHLFG